MASRFAGLFLLLAGLVANPFVLQHFLSHDRYIEPGKKIFVFACDAVLILLGLVFLRPQSRVSVFLRGKTKHLLLLLFSVLFTVAIAEAGLRIYLFHIKGDVLHLKSPGLYTGGQGDDDFWYFGYVWENKDVLAAPGKGNPKEFYANWPVSLEFDPVLGYKRKADVTFPGHETSNLGTRGLKQYTLEGPKIAFYGDSFVESNAFSDNTLTSMMEKKTGIDCLNYGVGGYGLDQIYLLFEQTYKQFDPATTRYLIGAIGEDLERMLLRVRQSAKPYFTADNGALVLHADHIDAADPKRFFQTYTPRFRSFVLELLAHKIKPLNDFFVARREREENARIEELTALLVKKFKETNRNVTFVIFSDWRGSMLKEELRRQGIPYIEADRCMKEYEEKSNVPAPQLYPAGHPSPELNEAIADCIVREMKS